MLAQNWYCCGSAARFHVTRLSSLSSSDKPESFWLLPAFGQSLLLCRKDQRLNPFPYGLITPLQSHCLYLFTVLSFVALLHCGHFLLIWPLSVCGLTRTAINAGLGK